MSEHTMFALLAQYNASMNDKLYAAAARLSPGELAQQRGAFFGSLIGTMNHIVAADTIWLQRFARHPADFAAVQPVLAMATPAGLSATFSDDLALLRAQRSRLDAIIIDLIGEVTHDDLAQVLHYQNIKGAQFHKRFGSVLLHFFNHQTHHRGQASTLLTQAGVDIGVTDLLVAIPDDA